MKRDKIIEELKGCYEEYFKKLGISAKNLISKENKKKELEGDRIFDPARYIGSKYGESKRILFVGLSRGVDNKKKEEFLKEEKKKMKKFTFEDYLENIRERIEDKLEKYQNIEDKEERKEFKPNPHIAGTYFQALYYLKKDLEWAGKSWRKLNKKEEISETILKDYQEELPKENPISYVALTDYCKSMYIGSDSREHKEGFVNKKIEDELFLEEIEIFNPEIIILQSPNFGKKLEDLIPAIKKEMKGVKIYVGYHPSNQGGIRINKKFLEKLLKKMEKENYKKNETITVSYRNPNGLIGTYEKL